MKSLIFGIVRVSHWLLVNVDLYAVWKLWLITILLMILHRLYCFQVSLGVTWDVLLPWWVPSWILQWGYQMASEFVSSGEAATDFNTQASLVDDVCHLRTQEHSNIGTWFTLLQASWKLMGSHRALLASCPLGFGTITAVAWMIYKLST